MMATAPVWMWPPGEISPIPAGSFTWTAPRGPGVFTYASEYLAEYKGLSIDPIALPTREGVFKTFREGGVFGALRDGGPDSWGEYQIKKRSNTDADLTPFERLTLGSANGAGSVVVGPLTPERLKPCWSMESLTSAAMRWSRDERMEGDPSFDEFLSLASPPTSLGGTKPKLELEHEGTLWISKFPDRGDPRDFACVEAAGLTLAEKCGIPTPRHRVITVGSGERTMIGLIG